LALRNIRDARAIEPLIQVLRDDRSTQLYVIDALKMIGKPAVDPLIRAPREQ
jgi:HEAT repeat protein